MQHNTFEKYCAAGRADLVKKWYLAKSININNGQGYPLRVSIRTGNIETIKIILSHPDIKLYEERPTIILQKALLTNNIEIIELVFNSKDISFKNINILHMMNHETISDEVRNHFITSEIHNFIIESKEYELLALLPDAVKDLFVF